MIPRQHNETTSPLEHILHGEFLLFGLHIEVNYSLSGTETTCVALLKSSPTHDYRSDPKGLLSLSHGVRPIDRMTSSILDIAVAH